MEMSDQAVDCMYTGDPDPNKVYLHDEILSSGKDIQEIQSAMKALNGADLDLACSSEKLVNLHVLLMHLLARDNDLETITMQSGNMSGTSIEKALVYDLLSGILDSELREVDNFLDALQAQIVDARDKISSCRHLGELFTIMEDKLHNSEELLKKSQEHVLELKMHSAKLPAAFSSLKQENWENDEAMELPEYGQLPNIIGKSKMRTVDQQRHVLRLLEKSIARELDLEKKISELEQNEEQLKLKLHHTEQVAFHMEEGTEVIWGRFLEAENAAEVLKGISKELLGRFQIVQFNLNGSLQREAAVTSKLEDCIEQMKAKDNALQNLDNRNAEDIPKTSEVLTLKENVKSLEEQLKETNIRLKNANTSYDESQEQLIEMENIVESLKESIYEAESKAESAEAKVTQLTDTNLELNEELSFHKGNNDSNTKKIGSLEKQLRELDIQLQNSKVSSEASQEQQVMLYTAIWDMETLIEDLKSKVSKAESKTESTEEQCILLSENNFELNKELSFMRERMKILELSLHQANNEKVASAKEVNLRTKLITDMVMQLAAQRELIQKQLYSLTEENKFLVEKLQSTEKSSSATTCNIGGSDEKKLPSFENDPIQATCMKASEDVVSLTTTFQVDEFSKDAAAFRSELGPLDTASNSTGTVSTPEAVRMEEAGRLNLKWIIIATLVAALSVSAIYILNKMIIFNG